MRRTLPRDGRHAALVNKLPVTLAGSRLRLKDLRAGADATPAEASGCCFGAFVSALLASVGAGQHGGIARSVRAAARFAGAADFCALAAKMLRVVGAADHEVGTDGADLHAIHHDGDVSRVSMMAALCEAVSECGEAALMAVETGFDASLHRVIVVMHGVISRDGMSEWETQSSADSYL